MTLSEKVTASIERLKAFAPRNIDSIEDEISGDLYINYDQMRKQIKDIPAADVRPAVHGHWEDRGSLSARCSECGCKSLRASDFYPNCGADMRGE